MLKLSELETLKRSLEFMLSTSPPKGLVTELENIILKYESARAKIRSRTKPFPEGELYELKVIKGLSIREIIQTIKKRRGVNYSRSSIEKAIRIENLVGKGRKAEEFRQRMERGKNNDNLDSF